MDDNKLYRKVVVRNDGKEYEKLVEEFRNKNVDLVVNNITSNTATINIKKLSEDAIIPTRAHDDDAGYDLYASASHDMNPHGTVVIPPLGARTFKTGIAMEIPKGFVGLVFARSGMGIKRGLTPRNCVGVIDSNYRGEILVSLYNDNQTESAEVTIGERIAQIVVIPYYRYELNVIEQLNETDRGENGFGSSGRR